MNVTGKASPNSLRVSPRLAHVLSGVGEALITLGVLLALFVVWEVWWTDVVGAHQQQKIVESLPWQVPPVPVGVSDEGAMGPSTPTIPVIAEEDKNRTDDPPSGLTLQTGETFATMYVPRWGTDYVRPISEGVGRRDVLDKLGIGHYPSTALPGGWGNFAVAGHRTTYGKPFNRIEELVEGDVIVVRTESTWYVYHVTDHDIVYPTFTAAIAPVPGHQGEAADGRYITLTTCHPKYSASRRYVVYGILDYWARASDGYPEEIVSSIEDTTTDGGA
jgi:sortase A